MESMTPFTTTSSVQQKFQSVQMWNATKLHYELADMYADLADYNRGSVHSEFFSYTLIFKLLAHSFLCTTWENLSEKFNELFKNK